MQNPAARQRCGDMTPTYEKGNHTMKDTTIKRVETYSAQEVADIIGVGKSTVCRAVRNGNAKHLGVIKVEGALRFSKQVIDNLVRPLGATA